MKTKIVAVTLLGAVVTTLSACDSTQVNPLTPAAAQPPTYEKTPEGAKQAEIDIRKLRLGHDYAGGWERWSKESKTYVSKADYIRYRTACDIAIPVIPEISNVRIEGDTATLTLSMGSIVLPSTLHWESGTWTHVLDKDAKADFKKGVNTLIEDETAIGLCKQ